jgi:lipopolysaccharide export LptBFGC system permease protein LptF
MKKFLSILSMLLGFALMFSFDENSNYFALGVLLSCLGAVFYLVFHFTNRRPKSRLRAKNPYIWWYLTRD